MLTKTRKAAIVLASSLALAGPSLADESQTRHGRAVETEMIQLDLVGTVAQPVTRLPGLVEAPATPGEARDPRAAADSAVDAMILVAIPNLADPSVSPPHDPSAADGQLTAGPQPDLQLSETHSVCTPWDNNNSCLVAESICDAIGGSWISNPDGTFTCISFD